jgi:hypothetical protein
MALVLRPLSIGEILDRTFSLYRNHFKLFVGIMVLPQLAIFATSLGMVVFPALIASAGGSVSPAVAVGVIGFLISVPIYLVVYFAAIGTGQAATVYAVSQVYLERDTTIGASYAFIRGRFWSVLGVIILTFLAVIVGVFALFIGAIFAWLFCSLAIPVTVLEGRDPVESIKRSFNLVKDDLGRIFVIIFVFMLLHWAISYMFAIPAIVLMAVLAQHGQPPIWVNSLVYLGGFVSGCLIMPMLNIALSIAYYDERVRKEAFDMQFMMATIDRNAMSAGAVAASSPLPPSV